MTITDTILGTPTSKGGSARLAINFAKATNYGQRFVVTDLEASLLRSLDAPVRFFTDGDDLWMENDN